MKKGGPIFPYLPECELFEPSKKVKEVNRDNLPSLDTIIQQVGFKKTEESSGYNIYHNKTLNLDIVIKYVPPKQSSK
mgnify:CR=1 FL=1